MAQSISINDKLHLPVLFDRSWYTDMQDKVDTDGPWHDPSLFRLALQAQQERMIPSFDVLTCLPHIHTFKPMPHQIETVNKVLNELHGEAILADEVGLGKTIEAGLILKEYMVRGQVEKALILVPSSLVVQWSKELNEKFHIPAIPQRKEYMWQQVNILVASLDTAKRQPHRDHVLQQEYDLLIVDEAHKLKNHQTKNYDFISRINRKHCLLLTATPIQNEMKELFHMVSLLKPGILGTQEQFQQQFTRGKRKTKNELYLQRLLSRIMIRNCRENEALTTSKRHVHNIEIELTPAEKELYNAITQYAQDQYRQQKKRNVFSMITLQREACSSREALYQTLLNMRNSNAQTQANNERLSKLITLVQQVEKHAKAEYLLTLIRQIKSKVIVFTEYKASQDYLQCLLYQNGIQSVPFRGGFRRNKKDWMIEWFKQKAQVLISTEAGGEGINLQFCQHVINYDLPWNPMRVEQRIGRVHRLGQEHDVHIYNLSTQGTIEQYILHLLYEKIHLFENVMGKLDQILDQVKLKTYLEEHLTDIFLDSSSTREIEIKMHNLTSFISTDQTHNPQQTQSRGV